MSRESIGRRAAALFVILGFAYVFSLHSPAPPPEVSGAQVTVECAEIEGDPEPPPDGPDFAQ